MLRRGLLLVACGPLLACSSNTMTDAGTDGGAPEAAPDAGTIPDAAGGCPEAAPDPSLADAAAPIGTQLRAGDALSVRGVTSDGYVVYSDDAALTLHAMPLSGGAIIDLGSLGSSFWVTLSGSVVFIWSNISGSNVGALSVWSAATGLHVVSQASLGLVATSTAAGDRILYVDHVAASGDTGDVYEAATDGTAAQLLVGSAVVGGCMPEVGFVGSYAIVTHCTGTTTGATVSSFAIATWGRTDLAVGAENYYAASSSTSEVLVSRDGVGIQAVPLGGGTPTTIDPVGFFGALIGDGMNALYSTKSHEMRRSPIASPSPTTIVPSNFGGFWGLSPDEQWALFFSQVGSAGGDMYLVSTSAPSAPVTLSTLPSTQVRGSAFTNSSGHALFTTGCDVCTGAGTLQAVAVGTGSPVVLGQQSWIEWAVGPSRVIFTDDFVASGGLRFGRSDIESVDLALTSTPTRLVDRADAVIGLSPAGDQLVYVWSARPGPLAGLYVAPL